jgi:hypothetical protein
MACSVIFHAITIGYRRKGVSPIKGGGDTRVGGLFNPGRTLESRVDLLRPVQEVEFVAPGTRWERTRISLYSPYRIFGEIAYVFSNLSNNNFIQTKFGLRLVFQAKN